MRARFDQAGDPYVAEKKRAALNTLDGLLAARRSLSLPLSNRSGHGVYGRRPRHPSHRFAFDAMPTVN